MVNWSSPSHHSHLSEEEKQPEQDKKSIVPSSSRRSLAPSATKITILCLFQSQKE
jgi:hypothetical protein